MLNGKTTEQALVHAFESGYSNAVHSLAVLTKNKINFNNFHSGRFQLDADALTDELYACPGSARRMLTTEIFGDITGKSYLFLTDREFELFTESVPDGKDPNVNLKEEFIKEVDNILSASVITHLSNKLGFKMHGDIPVLVGKISGKVDDIINDDFSERAEQVYISSMYFSLENNPAVKPLFVWIIEGEALTPDETATIL